MYFVQVLLIYSLCHEPPYAIVQRAVNDQIRYAAVGSANALFFD